MTEKEIIKKTADFIKKKLEKDSSHDWWHVYRVWQIAKKIGKKEGGDFFIIEMAALLHEMDDYKLEKKNNNNARKWLLKLNLEKEIADRINEISQNVSFKGAGVKSEMKTKEGKIVQDADRLDAIGAIGIARVFAYGGYKQREIYNPKIKPAEHETFAEYKKRDYSSINHFYEKLLLLKNLMNTKTGKKMAAGRHKFMENYLKEFFKEWTLR